MHLAHYTGWSLGEMDAMPLDELAGWVRQSVEYHNEMNAAPEE